MPLLLFYVDVCSCRPPALAAMAHPFSDWLIGCLHNPAALWGIVMLSMCFLHVTYVEEQEQAQVQGHVLPAEVGVMGTVCTPSTGRQWLAGRTTASDAMPADRPLNNIMQLLCSVGVSCRHTAARPSSSFSTACTSRMHFQPGHHLQWLQPSGVEQQCCPAAIILLLHAHVWCFRP